ncbi:MAG: ACP S-malonyltransferase [Candidatus Eisenbacteria bacterium]|nr:ACP S-malonyltransferase [Candidatus Eisenbacteria bacterium]
MQFGLLFPGQGSQHTGMGRELFEEYKLARETYEDADRILGYSISSISFDGPEETLRETRNTQPALFVHGIAAFRVLSESGFEFSVAAGHSLGEYSALTAAGALEFADALRLVRRRGELMHEAGLKRPGSMAAILGLSQAEVIEICDEASRAGVVQPANLNSSSQSVISGELVAVEAAVNLARERGAKRAVMLPVSGAFHSPLMESASLGLSKILAEIKINRAEFPVVANYSALPVREPEDIREHLAKQVLGAVRWEESVRRMLSTGVRHFLEVGPGNVLKGLMRSVDKEATVLSAGTPGDIASAVALLDRQKVT